MSDAKVAQNDIRVTHEGVLNNLRIPGARDWLTGQRTTFSLPLLGLLACRWFIDGALVHTVYHLSGRPYPTLPSFL